MNLLSIDTSTKKANVCLKYENKIINESIDNEITHSEKLLPLVDDVLKKSNCTLKDIDYIACSIGPGSFTGIRIGIATVKAFAKVTKSKVFGISSLDILAYTNTENASNYTISIIDAKNSRIYYSVYKSNRINDTVILENVLDYANDTIDVAINKINDLFTNLKVDKNSSIKVIGDCTELYKDIFTNNLNKIFDNVYLYNETMSGKALNDIAENYINTNNADNYLKDYLTLDALYVRPSQAERAKNNEL